MFRFVTRQLNQRSIGRQATFLRSLTLLNQIIRVPFATVNPITFARWIWAIVGTQFFFFGVLVFIYLGLLGLLDFLSLRDVPIIQDNWTSIIGYFNQAFVWLFVSNLLWVILVFCNHYTDIVVVFIQMQKQGFIGFVGAMAAFWDITVYRMAIEFIYTLYSNPGDLGDTKAIYEIILAWSNLGYIVSYYYGEAILFTLNSISPYLAGFIQSIVGAIGSYLGIFTTYLSWAVFSAWEGSVMSIHGIITPNVPGPLQSVMDSLFRPVASTITVSIILWILRYFLGFPW